MSLPSVNKRLQIFVLKSYEAAYAEDFLDTEVRSPFLFLPSILNPNPLFFEESLKNGGGD